MGFFLVGFGELGLVWGLVGFEVFLFDLDFLDWFWIVQIFLRERDLEVFF